MAPSLTSVTVLLGDQAQVTCRNYLDKPGSVPELVIDAPGVRLGVRPSGFTFVTDDDLATAEGLAAAAAAFLEQVKRLHTGADNAAGGASGSEAA